MEDSTMEAARASLDKKIDAFAEEELEHVTEVVFALLNIANEDGIIESPADASSTVSSTKFLSSPRLDAERLLHTTRTR